MKWRAQLRLKMMFPSIQREGEGWTDMKWEVIQAFDPIEQFAWKEEFGSWEQGRSIRSLDFDTYNHWMSASSAERKE